MYKIKSKAGSKQLDFLNVPRRYQNPNIDNVYFAPILAEWDKTKNITPQIQEKWLNKVITKIKNKAPMSSKALIVSRPTDDTALRVAFKIMITALDNGYSAKAYNLGFFTKNYENNENLEYDFLILYSLNQFSSDWKIDLVRDLLRKADKSFVIVVATCPKFGNDAKSALEFNYNFINFRFNGYIQADEIG